MTTKPLNSARSRPWDLRGRSPKNFFRPFGPQFDQKISGEPGPPMPPLDPPLLNEMNINPPTSPSAQQKNVSLIPEWRRIHCHPYLKKVADWNRGNNSNHKYDCITFHFVILHYRLDILKFNFILSLTFSG